MRSFELATAAGDILPPAAAGPHIEAEMGEDSSRQYSLHNVGAGASTYRIAALKDPLGRGG